MICPLLSIGKEEPKECDTDCVMYASLTDKLRGERECALIINMKSFYNISDKLWEINRGIDALYEIIRIK